MKMINVETTRVGKKIYKIKNKMKGRRPTQCTSIGNKKRKTDENKCREMQMESSWEGWMDGGMDPIYFFSVVTRN